MPRRLHTDDASDRELARALAGQFGANLKRCREAAGLSRPQLGARSNLHRSRIAALERGTVEPRLETLLKVADGIGVGLEELLAGIAWEPAEIGLGAFVLTDQEEREAEGNAKKGGSASP